MEIFLPSDQAAAIKIRAEARFTVDYEPDRVAVGFVSFVSPEAQFTPKEVETRSERDKLMFRVKIQVPSELVLHYIGAHQDRRSRCRLRARERRGRLAGLVGQKSNTSDGARRRPGN